MTTLSTHVLDTERGTPAVGVDVALYRDDRPLARAETDAGGRISNLANGSLDPATYRLVFDVAAYYAAHGRDAPFLQRVSIEFRVAGSDSHYHVPLLLSPYACTTYRGS
jgi:5-hydroxyisourate hydrolase